MTSLSRLLVVLVLMLISSLQVPVFAQENLIQVTDLLKIRQLSAVSVSPDGNRIVYTVTEIADHDDRQNPYRYRTHLWLVPADGSSAPRQLTFGSQSASQPAWHPDGKRLAFVRSVEGRSQIFVLSFEGGEPVQYTFQHRGASGPVWSPDGRKLLFSSSLPFNDILEDPDFADGPNWPLERAGRTLGDVSPDVKANPDGDIHEIRAWLAKNVESSNPRVLHRLNFQAETDLNPNLSFNHLHVMNDKPGDVAAPLTRGFHSFGGGSWSSDSRHVYFHSTFTDELHPDRANHSNIYRVDADGGNLSEMIHLETHSAFNANVSPNGRYLAFQSSDLSDLGYAQTEIRVLDTRTGNITHLTRGLDRSTGNITWSRDSQFVYFTTNSNGGTPLYRVSVADQSLRRLTSFEQGIRSFDVHANGIAYVLTEVSNPFELYHGRFNTGRNVRDSDLISQKKRLSNHNAVWLADKKLSYPERGVVQNGDFEVEYWIMKPANFEAGSNYPLMLQIHGGPSAMWGPGEASMWHEFQYFAARGYGIVYSNPRGSGGYGRDFQHGNYRDWGFGPASDVLAATDGATALSWTDPERLVTTGGSYAGYLVAWIIAHDHRFKAAFAQRGVYDLKTFLGEGNAWRLVPNHFGGFPWENEVDSVLTANSPLTYVSNIQTPLLIKHGDVDLRTGVIQSEMLYKSLKIQNKEVEYVRYPRASHEMSRSGEVLQRMDRILRIYEFFERYVGN